MLLCVLVLVSMGDGVLVSVDEGVLVPVELGVPVDVELGVPVCVVEGVLLCVELGVAVCVEDDVTVWVELSVLVPVDVLEVEGVKEVLAVAVTVGDVVPLGVCDRELVGVRVPVAEDEPVDDDELVDAAVLEPAPDTLLVVVVDDVALLVPVGEGDDERLRMLAMLRPRKVMLDTAASASPASHSVERSTPLEYPLEGISCVMLTRR